MNIFDYVHVHVCISVPAAVGELSFPSTTTSQFTVEWSAPAGGDVTKYRVTITQNGNSVPVDDVMFPSTSAVVSTGVDPGSAYDVSVVAILDTGNAVQGELVSEARNGSVTTSKQEHNDVQ